MLDFTRDIEPYLQLGADGKPNAKLRHAFYQASIDHRQRLREVFRKKYPDYLNINRPKERDAYKKYREAIYRNPLRSLRRRVIEVLDYIRQADDFDVSFPSSVAADKPDSFESYVTNNRFTTDGSALDWFFSKVRKKYVDDPNAVLVVLPLVQPVSDTERATPVPMLVSCDCVYQYRKGEFAVLEAPEKTWIIGPTGKPEKAGKILLFLDSDSYCVARQLARQTVNNQTLYNWDITGAADVFNAEDPTKREGISFRAPLHNCPVMPAVKIGKVNEDEAEEKVGKANSYTLVSSNDAGEEYFESILTDALPHVEGAQEVGSDIQVERNFHVSGEEWRYASKRCPDSFSAGSGECVDGMIPLRDETGTSIIGKAKCPKCDGGYITSGSGVNGLIIVSAPTATSMQDEGRPTNLPTPPGGFIPRNIEPLREFVKEYEREKKQAFETINMQFLMETPVEQSGTAKRMDREELYRTLVVEGAHLCKLLQLMLESVAYQRNQQGDAPKVLAPVRLSIENSELTRAELAEAVKNSFDKNLRSPLEKKLIEYQAGKDSDYYRRYELREQHDPYANHNMEDKLFLLSAARLTMDVNSPEMQTLTDGIMLSIHFDRLVSDQLRTNRDAFLSLPAIDQYNRLLEGAKKLTGTIKAVQIDPKTGTPALSEGQLIPLVDIKNNGQLS